MTETAGTHGPVRIVIGLILTGFAFVMAGRHTRRHSFNVPAHIAAGREWPSDGGISSTPPDPSVAGLEDATGAALGQASMVPEALLSPPSGPRPHQQGARPPEFGLAREATATSFEAVMAHVSTLLETASRLSIRLEHRERSALHAIRNAPAGPEPELDVAVPGEALPDIAAGAALFLAEASSPAPGSGPVLPAAGAADDAELALMEALRRTGLDDSVVEAVAEGLHRGENLDAALLAAFGSLSPAPPLPRLIGSLLVVVGPGGSATRLARALAGEMGIDGAGIPFASRDAGAHVHGTGRLLVRTVEDAAEAAPGWRRSSPALVVVDATVGGPDRGWARDLIAAVRPTAVWAVVEATAKSEDIAAWAHDLGGLDALALENLTATVSPASALGTGVAVARLDGQPASASRWVATIVDRVDPCT